MENESMPSCLMSRAILSMSCVMNASKPLAVDDPEHVLQNGPIAEDLVFDDTVDKIVHAFEMAVEPAAVELGLLGDHADGDVGEPMMLEQGPECVC